MAPIDVGSLNVANLLNPADLIPALPLTVGSALSLLNNTLTNVLPTLLNLGISIVANPVLDELCVGNFNISLEPPLSNRPQINSQFRVADGFNCLIASPGKELLSFTNLIDVRTLSCPAFVPGAGQSPVAGGPIPYPTFVTKWNNDGTHSVIRINTVVYVQGSTYTQVFVGEVLFGQFQGKRVLLVAQNQAAGYDLQNTLCALGLITIPSNLQLGLFAILA